MNNEVVIVSSARTPVGDFNGSLKGYNAVDLGVFALKGAIEKCGIDPGIIEECVGGHLIQSAAPGNSARVVALASGLPVSSTAVTVMQQCPSSMRAAEICSQELILGKIDVGAAVGFESETNTPYYLPRARWGYRMGDGEQVQDSLMIGGLICPWNHCHMGVTAENIAEMYGITREEQDEYAVMSNQRACKSNELGLYKDELVPIEIKNKKKGNWIMDKDEHPNPNASMESFSKLRPAFKKGGTVTSANASSLNDAGSAIIMMTAQKAKELELKPLARVVSSASGSVDPKIMGMGLVPAVRRALKFADLDINDIDYWELNEAFAAQVLGCNRELKLPLDRMNTVGSGISIGHPVGSTGIRLIISCISELKRRGGRYGVASMCASGGPACAFIVENLK